MAVKLGKTVLQLSDAGFQLTDTLVKRCGTVFKRQRTVCQPVYPGNKLPRFVKQRAEPVVQLRRTVRQLRHSSGKLGKRAFKPGNIRLPGVDLRENIVHGNRDGVRHAEILHVRRDDNVIGDLKHVFVDRQILLKSGERHADDRRPVSVVYQPSVLDRDVRENVVVKQHPGKHREGNVHFFLSVADLHVHRLIVFVVKTYRDLSALPGKVGCRNALSVKHIRYRDHYRKLFFDASLVVYVVSLGVPDLHIVPAGSVLFVSLHVFDVVKVTAVAYFGHACRILYPVADDYLFHRAVRGGDDVYRLVLLHRAVTVL
ncbi:unknown [Candidatus Colimorpha enterica]|uniref:Uncharacterized protein n=1 Tax=Candidatus Colimorpha enterica TaxID=3083063 RepID=R6TW63_9BACT|nr:unknown [Candidatus Colimorpha enterica]